MKPLRIMFAGVLLVFAVILSGCGGTQAADAGDSRIQSLTIYTPRDKAAVNAVVAAFVQRFPQYEGQVNVVTMSAQDALTRLRAEKGNPQAGFLWGGTQQGLSQAAHERLLAPSSPDIARVMDPARRDAEGRWYAEMLLPEVIVYNNERLTKDDAPKDWDDLIEPRFKNRILIRDVMASGTMRTIFSAMVYRQFARTGSPDAGYEWLRKLDANTVNYAANPDDMYFKLDRGVGTVTLWNLQDVLIQSRKGNRPLSYVIPASGAPILLDGVGVVNNPKSMQAAEEFQNFLLQPEMQLFLARNYFQIPAIPLGGAELPGWLTELKIKEMTIDWNLMSEKQTEWMTFWSKNIQNIGRR